MAEPQDPAKAFMPDVSEVIARSAESTDLSALQRRGYSKVRVLDEKRLKVLIYRAVQAALQSGSKPYLEHERQRIEEAARKEFQELLEKHQTMAKTQERFESLTKQVGERLTSLKAGEDPARSASESQFFRAAQARKEGLARVEADLQEILDRFEESEKLRLDLQEKHENLVKEYARIVKRLSEIELAKADPAPERGGDSVAPAHGAGPGRAEAEAAEERVQKLNAALNFVQREREALAEALGEAKAEVGRLQDELDAARREAEGVAARTVAPTEGLRIIVED